MILERGTPDEEFWTMVLRRFGCWAVAVLGFSALRRVVIASGNLPQLDRKPVPEAILARELANHVEQEDEHKFRCRVPDSECAKLFVKEHFWKKHVEMRHAEWLSRIKQEVGTP